MANVNALTKQKQIALLIAVLFGLGLAVGGGWYISTADKRKQADSLTPKEPVPDMTGVVNQTFDDKVQQSAVTEFQLVNKEMREQLAAIRKEMGMLARDRKADQDRLASLEQENSSLKETLSGQQDTPSGEPVPAAAAVIAGSPVTTVGDVPPPLIFIPAWALQCKGASPCSPWHRCQTLTPLSRPRSATTMKKPVASPSTPISPPAPLPKPS
ncbi:hypothetical protein [Aeromonas dhakensis]|uniref:hypothetical protein n=1 Tax=Aeromonas dhakensis TaxID=196024 RepID=UPI002379ADA5|nr:hypothetical protein [Aeromonas dhakensis]MDD9212861.1 hypothetical protein [Aeromonas dhakensis]